MLFGSLHPTQVIRIFWKFSSAFHVNKNFPTVITYLPNSEGIHVLALCTFVHSVQETKTTFTHTKQAPPPLSAKKNLRQSYANSISICLSQICMFCIFSSRREIPKKGRVLKFVDVFAAGCEVGRITMPAVCLHSYIWDVNWKPCDCQVNAVSKIQSIKTYKFSYKSLFVVFDEWRIYGIFVNFIQAFLIRSKQAWILFSVCVK